MSKSEQEKSCGQRYESHEEPEGEQGISTAVIICFWPRGGASEKAAWCALKSNSVHICISMTVDVCELKKLGCLKIAAHEEAGE